jgi:iron(II)-dependent oxidoreductase
MPVPPVRSDIETLARELEATWRRTDAIFTALQPEALLAQPIPQRHPFIYYLGHLPAYAWEQVCRGTLDRGASSRPALDDLFSRRANPISRGLAGERVSCGQWPHGEEVLAYRDEVRTVLRVSLGELGRLGGERALHSVIEHEFLHQETLLHMAMCLEGALKRPQSEKPALSFGESIEPRSVLVPEGAVTLGADADTIVFGWDHESPAETVQVPAFRIDRTPVMNGEFLEFVSAGGYQDPAHWAPADWQWREQAGLHHPVSWREVDGEWFYRGLFEDLPMTRVFDWPVYVSWAEACAFLTWRGQRLPTEAEFRRAAYGTPAGDEQRYPWGDAKPAASHGNFDWVAWSPVPVGSHPDGESAFGVLELVGNGWEWTASQLDPRNGSPDTLPEQPDEHYVRLGASWATPARLLRPSYRRWSQPHDPFVFGKFRGVRPA